MTNIEKCVELIKSDDITKIKSISFNLIESDPEAAFLCFSYLAKNEDPDSYFFLGLLYLKGQGTNKNEEFAFKYFRKIVEVNSPNGLHNLALLYYKGDGVEENHEIAYKYFEMAARLSYHHSFYYLGVMNFYGQGTTKDYQKSFDYFEKGAMSGDDYSSYKMATMLYDGNGVDVNYSKAYEIFKSLLDKGFKEGAIFLGQMNYFGEDREINLEKALYYYELAANSNDSRVYIILADIYSKGLMGKTDFKKAFYYYKKASLDDSIANFELGQMYHYGISVLIDDEKAFNYFYKAYEHRHRLASNYVSIMLYNGIGIKENKELATSIYEEIKSSLTTEIDKGFTTLSNEIPFEIEFKNNEIIKNIDTSSIYLRKLKLDDVIRIKEIINVKGTNLFDDLNDYDDDGLDYYINYLIDEDKNGYPSYAIIDIMSDKFIGMLNIFLRKGKTTIGYYIDKDYWQKGIMTKALTLMLCEVFKETSFDKIYADVSADNIASIKVLLKNGFKYESSFREYYSIKDFRDGYYLYIDKKNYDNLNKEGKNTKI